MRNKELKEHLINEITNDTKKEVEYLNIIPELSAYFKGRVAATRHALNLLEIL